MKMPVIAIADDSRYASVALIVDQPKLADLVELIRSRLYSPFEQIDLPIDHKSFEEKYQSFHYRPTSLEASYYDQVADRIEKLESLLANSVDRVLIQEYEELLVKAGYFKDSKYQINQVIDWIIKSFQLNPSYRDVIRKLIFCNEIHESDYRDQGMRGRVECIKRDREWYWLNKRTSSPNRLGYKKIATKYAVNIKTVEQAIRSYQTRLENSCSFKALHWEGLDLG